MTRDEALEKVKKCLALASSPEAHEAAAALRQAQKLMQMYGLTELDVSLADVSEFAQGAQNTPVVRWESALANMVAEAFGCEVFTTVGLKRLGTFGNVQRQRKYVFVGVNAMPELAGYAFDVLSRQCAKGRRAYIKAQPKNCKPKTKVARGDAWAEGWLHGVSDKLDRFAGKPETEALVKEYMQARHPNMAVHKTRDRTRGRNVTGNESWAGAQAGRKAELNHGVGKHEQSLIGG